ncbi:MAG: gamma-glutamyltransferase [Sneathiella sp.]|nr:gamma-glutamyltransferase [Sneathiella sp.]
MRFIKNPFPLLESKVKKRNHSSQWMRTTSFIMVGSLLLLGACESSKTQLGVVDSVTGPLGGAASDEPRATLVAQDVLSAGGSAADAATALYFTLAVTYPIAGSLGGGGECIVYNRDKGAIENLKFNIGTPKAGGNIGVPGNLRGFAALHARYGKMTWAALLSQAEQYANFGENMSRAQHIAMLKTSSSVFFDKDLEKLFKNSDGSFKAEGSKLQQIRLASVLTSLRSNGGASFYGGSLAKTFVADANAAGGKLTTLDLQGYKPSWSKALIFNTDTNSVGVSNSEYGRLFRDYWVSIFDGKGVLAINGDVSIGKVVNASAVAFQKYTSHSVFVSEASTSFVTSDNEGNAVSCVVGLKKPFGVGQIGDISGIVLAPNLPNSKSEFPTTPFLIANKNTKDFYYAGSATGGAAGTMGSIFTVLQIFAEDKTLDDAIRAPRAFTMGPGLPLLYEKGVPKSELNALNNAHPVMLEVDKLGAVNAIHCFDGKLFNCKSQSDPRGYGLSMIQE